MHCTHCGTGAAEGTKYCPGCGERLGPESKNPAGPDRQGPQSAMLILGTVLLGISLSAGAFLLYLVLTGSPSEVRDASARPSEVASKHNLEQKVADPDPQALLTAAPVLPGASRLARSVSTTAGGETPTPVAGVAHLAPEPLRLLPTPQPRAARSTWSVSQDVDRPVAVRVGGDVRMPVKIRNVDPAYPSIARAARVGGSVVLDAVITDEGRVTGVRVVNSAPLLDEAAMVAVWQWQYEPALLNGVAVPVSATINVTFIR